MYFALVGITGMWTPNIHVCMLLLIFIMNLCWMKKDSRLHQGVTTSEDDKYLTPRFKESAKPINVILSQLCNLHAFNNFFLNYHCQITIYREVHENCLSHQEWY